MLVLTNKLSNLLNQTVFSYSKGNFGFLNNNGQYRKIKTVIVQK